MLVEVQAVNASATAMQLVVATKALLKCDSFFVVSLIMQPASLMEPKRFPLNNALYLPLYSNVSVPNHMLPR